MDPKPSWYSISRLHGILHLGHPRQGFLVHDVEDEAAVAAPYPQLGEEAVEGEEDRVEGRHGVLQGGQLVGAGRGGGGDVLLQDCPLQPGEGGLVRSEDGPDALAQGFDVQAAEAERGFWNEEDTKKSLIKSYLLQDLGV